MFFFAHRLHTICGGAGAVLDDCLRDLRPLRYLSLAGLRSRQTAPRPRVKRRRETSNSPRADWVDRRTAARPRDGLITSRSGRFLAAGAVISQRRAFGSPSDPEGESYRCYP